jgi:RimJ/RimL family protein N-acetyltransferase
MKRSTGQRFLNSDGRLEQWPSHRDDKLLVLAYLASKFDPDTTYTEREVNELLNEWHTFGDWPLLRRELFDRGFIDRNRDGTNYHLRKIPTPLDDLYLVMPSVVRDAPIAVGWLEGDDGRETLRLMGNTDEYNKPTTLEKEQTRIRDFITSTDHTTWMMLYHDKPVGAVWVDRKPTDYLPFPSVHIMIGDPSARRKGIGQNAVETVIQLLKEEGLYDRLYSRHLLTNLAVASTLGKGDFAKEGEPYTDKDGLEWQNVSLALK